VTLITSKASDTVLLLKHINVPTVWKKVYCPSLLINASRSNKVSNANSLSYTMVYQLSIQHHNIVSEYPKHLYLPQAVILEQCIDSILDGPNEQVATILDSLM
jgi:hypothetical protein